MDVDSSSVHNTACVILHVTKNLLTSGLEQRLHELAVHLRETKKTVSYDLLLRQCSSLLIHICPDVTTVITNMIRRYGCQNDCEEGCSAVVECDIVGVDEEVGTEGGIFVGAYGRQLDTTEDVHRGDVLLRENRPFLVCLKSQCQCSVDCILVEHLLMTWTLIKNRLTVERLNQTSGQVYYNRAKSNMEYFLINLQSGLLEDDVMKADECWGEIDANMDNAGQCGDAWFRVEFPRAWSFSQHCLLVSLSVVSAIYFHHTCDVGGARYDDIVAVTHTTTDINETHRSAGDADSHERNKEERTSERNVRSLYNAARVFLQVLSRLPTNVHSVSEVTDDRDSFGSNGKVNDNEENSGTGVKVRSMTQDKLGYALYLRASAMNHSCRPTASVRFDIPPSPQQESKDRLRSSLSMMTIDETPALSPLHRLQSCRIEVIAFENLGAGSEATISYGPITGKHGLSSRQRALRKQYLFLCRCGACLQEYTSLMRNNILPQGASSDGNHDAMQSLLSTLCTRYFALTGKDRSKISEFDCANRLVSITETCSADAASLVQEFSVLIHQYRVSSSDSSKSEACRRMQRFDDNRLGSMVSRLSIFIPTAHSSVNCTSGEAGGRSEPSLDGVSSAAHPQLLWCHNPHLRYLCSLYCSAIDMRAQILATLRSFGEASTLVARAIDVMLRCGLYASDDDVAVARERVKLAGLLLAHGDVRGSCGNAQRAVDAMEAVISQADPDLMEAKQILSYLSSF